MISIALCTYNGEKFLPEQLESIRRQTRLPDELVVCDDCSADSTLKILRAFAGSAPFPVHILRNGRNLGSTGNFEQAIRHCCGDIIALCDQDDIWRPNKLQRIEEVFQSNPEAGYAFSDADIVDEHLNPAGCRLWESVGFSGDISEQFSKGEQLHCLVNRHVVTGATMAFRTDIGKLAMPFPKSGNWIHDGWIALVASAIAARGVPIGEPLIAYRQHSNQQIGAPVPSATNDKSKAAQERKSFLGMFRELKKRQKGLFEDWENQCSQVISLMDIVTGKLAAMKNDPKSRPAPDLERNLEYLRGFETHFINRRKILTSGNPGRYKLIYRETVSGRYAQFSDSWRSIFRDLFL